MWIGKTKFLINRNANPNGVVLYFNDEMYAIVDLKNRMFYAVNHTTMCQALSETPDEWTPTNQSLIEAFTESICRYFNIKNY